MFGFHENDIYNLFYNSKNIFKKIGIYRINCSEAFSVDLNIS